MNSGWNKTENEAGYPCYVEVESNKQQFDHPRFHAMLNNVKKYDDIKYSAYRTAFKVYYLQSELKVPPLRISSGVLGRHRLSLSESSLSLDAAELEAVLSDIYFAAEKESIFVGDIDLAVDLLLNFMLNIYDRDRKEPIRVLAAKTLLILLSEESTADKWVALSNCAADHNGCVSARRMTALLSYVAALASYLGDKDALLYVNDDVNSCFNKSAGMLGISASAVCEWAASSSSARWLPVLARISANRLQPVLSNLCCGFCNESMTQVLQFKCSKCDVFLCENCYLYDNKINISGHKKTHLVQEIIHGEPLPTNYNFLKGVKKLFFCTKKKKKRSTKKKVKSKEENDSSGTLKKKKDEKPAIFTSTVGKASGNSVNNPTIMLQDIINQLESQNIALKELSNQLMEVTKGADENIKQKVDVHWGQIADQINRLKILKENIAPQSPPSESTRNNENQQIKAFDLFSPIAVIQEEKPLIKNQPRVLSLDSGNFSVVSKNPDEALMVVSGDAMKPVVVQTTTDSISTVSMNDISFWYNDTQMQGKHTTSHTTKPPYTCSVGSDSLCVTEERYDADLRSVASSNDKMKELNADLDTVLNRLQEILTHNFAMDDSCFDNSQLRETANEMEGLLGTLIRGVEQRATLNGKKVSSETVKRNALSQNRCIESELL